MGQALASGEIVKEYLRKYPTHPSNAIAKIITAEVPGLFSSSEKARCVIRYYRGSHGSKSRKGREFEQFRINVPEPEVEEYKPFILGAQDFPIIAGGDAHVPYHDQDALEIFIEQAVRIRAKTVLLCGDWADFYQVSRFNKDPRRLPISEEIRILREIISMIRQALPAARIIYKIGNHEERLQHYIWSNATALTGLEEVELPSLLRAKENRIEFVDHRRVIKALELYIIHGHEYTFAISNPVNPARGLYLRAKKSALCFHFHQSSDHTETAINDDVVTTWSGGCLCGIHPEYMPLNKWNLGFAEIGLEGDGLWQVRNRRIINYRLI